MACRWRSESACRACQHLRLGAVCKVACSESVSTCVVPCPLPRKLFPSSLVE